MNLSKLIINLFGGAFEVYLIILFFENFCIIRVFKRYIFTLSFIAFSILDLILITFFENKFLIAIGVFIIIFLLGFYFQVRLSSQILLSIIYSTTTILSEYIMSVVLMEVLKVDIKPFENISITDFIGIIDSKLLTLIIVYTIQFYISLKNKQHGHKWFSLIMISLSMQSLILCFLVQKIKDSSNDIAISKISLISLFISFVILFITTLIFNNQIKLIAYKHEYISTQDNLLAQIEHYNELYSEQQNIRSIRHDMKDMLLGVTSLLKNNEIDRATKYLSKIYSDIETYENIVDTGFPVIDGILNSKNKQAQLCGGNIEYNVLISHYLYIDHLDMAIIISNGLQNAIEAITTESDINKRIILSISSKSDYISIFIENHTANIVSKNLKTTKSDKKNHGFGLSKMKSIASKYKGALSTDFDVKTYKFTLKILLKNESP